MTISWSRSPLGHLRYFGNNLQTLHKLSKCCRCRCRSIIICWRLNDGRNYQFRCAILLSSFTEVVGYIITSQLYQFVKLHLLLLKPLHSLLDPFGDCAHHPARFAIFAQLALLCLFILICSILPIVRTCKITQTLSDGNHHLLKCLFGLFVRHSHDFSMLHIILLLLNRWLCVFNSLSCPSGLYLNIILNPFLILFIA